MEIRTPSLDRARAALSVGRRADALEALSELRGRRPPGAALLEAEALVGLLRWGDALAVVRRVLPRTEPGDLRARLRLVKAEALMRAGEGRRGRQEVQAALDEAATPLTQARAHEQLLRCALEGELFRTAWRLYAETGHAAGLARLTGWEAALLAGRSEVEEALELQWRRVHLAGASTRLDLEAEARCDAGELLKRLGRWEEAAAQLEAAAGIFRALRDPRESAVAGSRRAAVDLARGDLPAVRRALQRAESTAGTSARHALLGELRLAAEDLALAESDAGGAEAAAREALGFFVAVDSAEGRCRARARCAHARISLGDPAGGVREARRALGEALPDGAGPPRLAELALGRAALRKGRRGEARSAFERAAAGRGDAVLLALARLGIALADARASRDSRLREALRALDALGEQRLSRLGRYDVEAVLGPGGDAQAQPIEVSDPGHRAVLLLELLRGTPAGPVQALHSVRGVLAWRRLARLDAPRTWLLEPGDSTPGPLPPGDPLARLGATDAPARVEIPGGQVVVVLVDGALLAAELPPGDAAAGLAPDLLRAALALVPAAADPGRRFGGLIAGCPAMRRLLERVELLARGDDPVHVCGETGAGKEGIAQLLHTASGRRGRCVAVNSAGLDDELFHSELFGHVRGAFSGAGTDREGFVEVAEGGTLFLDEVADLSPRSQARLLRFLETGEYVRLGEARPRRARVRVVSAANVDLRERVRDGSFRQDLWYRLGAAIVEVPPLRERGEDVLALARHFLEEVAVERRTPAARLGPDAEAALLAWSWPGNVRELRTEMRRAALEAAGGRIRARDLASGRRPLAAGPGGSLRAAQTRGARLLIEDALEKAGGNRTRAAAALGISRQALLARLRRLDL